MKNHVSTLVFAAIMLGVAGCASELEPTDETSSTRGAVEGAKSGTADTGKASSDTGSAGQDTGNKGTQDTGAKDGTGDTGTQSGPADTGSAGTDTGAGGDG